MKLEKGMIFVEEYNKGLICKTINFFSKLVVCTYRKKKEIRNYPHCGVVINEDKVFDSSLKGVKERNYSFFKNPKEGQIIHIYRLLQATDREIENAIVNMKSLYGGQTYGLGQLFGIVIAWFMKVIFKKEIRILFSKGIVCSELVMRLINLINKEYTKLIFKSAIVFNRVTVNEVINFMDTYIDFVEKVGEIKLKN